jgi:hypothetical protein
MICRSSILPLLLLVLVAGGMTGCNGQAQPIRTVDVHTENSEARKETLVEMRTAWRDREVRGDLRGQRAEQRFLVRLAGAVPRFKDTESYVEFCRFWNECLREHLARFPDSAT